MTRVDQKVCWCGSLDDYSPESFCDKHKHSKRVKYKDDRLQRRLSEILVALVFFSFCKRLESEHMKLVRQCRGLFSLFISRITGLCRNNFRLKMLLMDTMVDPQVLGSSVPPRVFEEIQSLFSSENLNLEKAVDEKLGFIFDEGRVSDLSKRVFGERESNSSSGDQRDNAPEMPGVSGLLEGILSHGHSIFDFAQ